MTTFYSRSLGLPIGAGLDAAREALRIEGLHVEGESEAGSMLPLAPPGAACQLHILSVSYDSRPLAANDRQPSGVPVVRFNVTVQLGEDGAEVTAVDPMEFLTDRASVAMRQQAILASAALRAAFDRL